MAAAEARRPGPETSSGPEPRPDAPAAPDGSDRRIGTLRRPSPPAVRGPGAGVPDVSFGLSLFTHAPPDRLFPVARPSDHVRFQHRSERQFAQLLDHYGIAWRYEPDEFPIGWDDDGQVNAAFRPDFYLPAFDTYIEITTSQQRLVTKKNRKLRLLREHHPEVRVKLFYQRDYLELARRFGIDDLDLLDEEE